jgi:N-acetylglucosamine-6-phosphate deacetylase
MQSRDPGIVGAALTDPDSWCGLIVDGHHVDALTLRVALAAKAAGRMMLVTDAMPTVGNGADSFQLAGQTVTVRDGRCVTADGTLAGSNLDMAAAVRNTVSLLKQPLPEALRMASLYPAGFLGLDDRRGRIAPGYCADLVLLDADLKVQRTWIGGHMALH